MFDSIANVNDYLSEHWLAEVFPSKLKDLAATWKELATKGKDTPVRGLAAMNGTYLTELASLPDSNHQDFLDLVTQAHQKLLRAVGFDAEPTVMDTTQAETPICVPLLARFSSPTSTDALHILQAVPVDSVDAVLGDDAELLTPFTLAVTSEKTEKLASVPKAITQLFVSDDPPRYLVVVAGAAVLVTDAARWSEGRYLAFDVATALDRRDDKATGELAFHAGLWSADVLLPNDDGKTRLDNFTEDSEKHAIGVSEDLREGLRISIEKIANEVLAQRRASGKPVEGIPELPRDLTTQSLRFLYRILFLLFAEARPELGILPVGAPEYGSGYGLDRLREIIQVPLTGSSASGHHLHDSLNLLFRLVNDGHNTDTTDGDGLVFEAMRSDLFDKKRTPLIDETRLSNRVLQEVLTLLLLSKPSKNKNKQRGFISYAQLGINQLGAVYEGLMSYSGLIAEDDMVEVAKDGNADRGSWLVPSTKSGDYDDKDLVWREDRLTGRKDLVRHPKASYVFRLSGRDRQRSASYYTPEVLTKCVVKHALAELITEDTKAQQILEYRICEPALGSGAFLNEAINQLAVEYLNRRQDELGERIEPEAYATELQKVKAYIALHRAYGVDLNSTAVELAEVSLWLNVMHRGLRAPWFGLHLRRGNSLIGARRATYDFTSLGRAKKTWLKTPPTDRPLKGGAIGTGEIHHFLLPAEGWGAVADAKQAKELVPDQAAALRRWRTEVLKKPSAKHLDRLRALARRVERLWELSSRRLEISEREVSRYIPIWGADPQQVTSVASREQVESELRDPEGPYMRLRLAMDAWCALWFWPLEPLAGEEGMEGEGPPDLDDWISMLEALLGAAGVHEPGQGQGMFHETIERFDQLSKFDDLERQFSGMRPTWKVVSDHKWLGRVLEITESQGFFHWELDFANVFQQGGFHLQVGNPPWVRTSWDGATVLADHDAFLGVMDQKKTDRTVWANHVSESLSDPGIFRNYLVELSSIEGALSFLSSSVYFSDLGSLTPNLYRNFMIQVWKNLDEVGIAGLIHPDDHFFHDKGGSLRRHCYRRLRRHWGFINELQLFEDVSHTDTYGVHVYGGNRVSIAFRSASALLHPVTLERSLDHDGSGEVPGMQYEAGGWDLRPHRNRLITVDETMLRSWSDLFEAGASNFLEARMPAVTSQEQSEALKLMAKTRTRMLGNYLWSRCWEEDKFKADGIAIWKPHQPATSGGVVLQPPHIGVSNPFAKQPAIDPSESTDFRAIDLVGLNPDFVPTSNYQLTNDVVKYNAGIRRWGDERVTDFWRLAWRRRLGQNMERTLQSALVAPGVPHVNTVHTLVALHESQSAGAKAQVSDRMTAIVVGLWSSIPYDFLIKLSGADDLWPNVVDHLPLPTDHPSDELILHRALRLNCLTREYAPLWNSLHNPDFDGDKWTDVFRGVANPFYDCDEWREDTPLRSELDRRCALVEIDALAAIALGLSADHLILMLRGQFSVLRKYEYYSYFDAKGRRIGADKYPHSRGYGQLRGDYELLRCFLEGGDHRDLLDRYTPFPPDNEHSDPWFYKPDRESELRTAHREFERRFATA
jgi:hypothetical protein